MRVLIHNVCVTDPGGDPVVLHGGDVLPEWAHVSSKLYRVVDDEPEVEVVEPVVREFGAYGTADLEEVDESDADEADWYGQV